MIQLLRDLYVIARPSGRRRLAAVLAMAVLQALMQTLAVFSLVPFLSAAADMERFRASAAGQQFVAAVGGGNDGRVLIAAGLLSLLLLIGGNFVGLAADYMRSRYAQSVGHRLRTELVARILERRYEYFLGINSSILLKNLVEDAGNVGSLLLMPALDVLARVLLAVLLVATVMVFEPWIVLGGCVLLVIYYLAVMRPIRAVAARASDALKDDIRRLYFEVNQVLSGIKPILATGRSPFFVRRIESASRVLSREFARLPMYSALPRIGLELLVFGGMIVWVIVAVATGGDIVELIPRVGLVAIVAYRLMPSIQLIFAHIAGMTSARQSLEEVTSLAREQASLAAPGPRGSSGALAEPLHWSREIRFDNVSFRYAGADEAAIDRVSFTIAKGKRVAFVGATGSGKSTIVDLLLGLLQPTSGRIVVDGRPLRPSDMPAWRRAVGYVPQDLFLLDGTIAENIAFGCEAAELDPGRIGEVADLAQAREFIEDGRSGGFEARVGERGVRLSGGQRQRLALARALYGRPNILIMDEATSALDPQTEQKVVAAMADTRDRLTVVTVTHRMSTVRGYDCIHFLDKGRIVASGDFTTLLAVHEGFREFAI